jgi:ferredoxin-type protein NapH
LSRIGIKERLLNYNTPRRIVQLMSFLFFSAIIFNLGALPLLFPVLWTWGLKTNTVGDAFTAIQFMFSGWNFTNAIFPWLGLASFLIVGILIGKSLCGWVCPFGLVQDLAGFLRRKQTDLSSRTHDTLVYGKYFILIITMLISVSYSISVLAGKSAGYAQALGVFVQGPFTALSPSETLFATLPKIVQGFRFSGWENFASDILYGVSTLSPLFWVQFAIMVIVLVFAVYVPRSWCRYLCPHGAIMAIMNRFSFIGLHREPFKCEKGACRSCVQVCPTRVPILDLPWEKFSHPECIYCMKCADACPHGAIKPTYP